MAAADDDNLGTCLPNATVWRHVNQSDISWKESVENWKASVFVRTYENLINIPHKYCA